MKVSEEDAIKGQTDTDPDSMFLKIAPRIEQRIIDVAKVGAKSGSNSVSPERVRGDEIEAFPPSKWHHLTRWLHMKEKPTGVAAVSEFVASMKVVE